MKELKTSQVGVMVGLTRQQIRSLALEGKIPGSRMVGKQLRFDGDSLEFNQWVETRLYFKQTNKKRPPEWHSLIDGFSKRIAGKSVLQTRDDVRIVQDDLSNAIEGTLHAIHDLSPEDADKFKDRLVKKLEEQARSFKRLEASRSLGRETGGMARHNGRIMPTSR